MDGGGLKESGHLFPFSQRQVFHGVIRHKGHQRKPTLNLDFLIKPQRDDLLNLSGKDIPGTRGFPCRAGRKDHVFGSDAEDHGLPYLDVAHSLNLLGLQSDATRVPPPLLTTLPLRMVSTPTKEATNSLTG